jgi:hypothetical protein
MMKMMVHKGTHLHKAGSSVSYSFLIVRFSSKLCKQLAACKQSSGSKAVIH